MGCTWALVYMAKTKIIIPQTYVPFFVAMAFDCGIIYYIGSAFAGRAL